MHVFSFFSRSVVPHRIDSHTHTVCTVTSEWPDGDRKGFCGCALPRRSGASNDPTVFSHAVSSGGRVVPDVKLEWCSAWLIYTVHHTNKCPTAFVCVCASFRCVTIVIFLSLPVPFLCMCCHGNWHLPLPIAFMPFVAFVWNSTATTCCSAP